MEYLDSGTSAPAIPVSPPRLCGSVEGVEFWVAQPRGRPLRCVITEAALQCHCGAVDERPESWMSAFLRYRDDIEGRALAATERRDNVHVVIVTDSEGRLKAAAGRCAP